MKIRNACMGLLTSLTIAHFTATAALAADVQEYIIAKGLDYHQTNEVSAVLATNESPFRFVASVVGTGSNSVVSASLKLAKASLTLTNHGGAFDLEQGFLSQKLLDKTFRTGIYTLIINSLNDGAHSPTLTLPKVSRKVDSYPAVPRVANWLDLQVVEPEQPLLVSWDAFTNGTPGDFIMLDIAAADGSIVASSPDFTETNVLTGTNLAFEIPPGLLDYSNHYEGRLMFLKKAVVNTTSYPGATGLAGYFKQTTFPLVTLPPPPDAGRIQFSAHTYSVAENDGPATITVVRSGDLGNASVNLFTLNGTATAGSDYDATSTLVKFHDGDTTATVEVPIFDDYLLEGNETVNLVLANASSGAELGSRTNAVLTIVDNELAAAGSLQFSPAVYTVSESNAVASLTVTRTGGSTGAVSADFISHSGSAHKGVNFVGTNGTVNFASGQTSATISVPLINDTLIGPSTTFSVQLVASASGAALGTNLTSTVTITDDDLAGTINFASAGISANENGTNFVVNVTRSGGTASGMAVDYFTTGGSATADVDYVSTDGTLYFGANETSKTILVGIINDTLAEGTETFTLHLENVTGGATLGTTNVATLTIVDDESAISLASASYVISEASTNLAVTLTRSGALLTAVSVDFATLGGTASAVNDYHGTNGTLNFPANTNSATILVPIVDNAVVDSSRTFNFRLSNPQGGVQLGTVTNALVTITNNDFAGTIQFAATTFTGTEGSNAVITLTRTGGTASGVFIYVNMVAGTATAGADYTNMSGYVAFNAGETNKTIVVPVIADGLSEPTETVFLSFGSVIGGATIGSPSTATLSLLDKPDPNAIPLNGPLFIKGTVGGVAFTSNVGTEVAADSPGGNFLVTANWTSGSGLGTILNLMPIDVFPQQVGTLSLTDAGTHGNASYTAADFSGSAKVWDLAGSSTDHGATGTFIFDAIDHTAKLASGRFTLHLYQTTGIGAGGFIDIVGSFRIKLQ